MRSRIFQVLRGHQRQGQHPYRFKGKEKKSDQDKSLSDTALYALCEIALVAGDINQVKACIADGYNPNYESRYGIPLEIASNLPETQRIEMAKLLLDAGARVNALDRDGWTLLQWAAEKGEKDLVKLLLEHAANVNVRSKYIKHTFAFSRGKRPHRSGKSVNSSRCSR